MEIGPANEESGRFICKVRFAAREDTSQSPLP
jgi:hypothetical protein